MPRTSAKSRSSLAKRRASATKRSKAETKDDICEAVSLAQAQRAIAAMDKDDLCALITKQGWKRIRDNSGGASSGRKAVSAKKSKVANDDDKDKMEERHNLWREINAVVSGSHLGLTPAETVRIVNRAEKRFHNSPSSAPTVLRCPYSFIDLSRMSDENDVRSIRYGCMEEPPKTKRAFVDGLKALTDDARLVSTYKSYIDIAGDAFIF